MINVIVSGLDSDYKQKLFTIFLNIIPYCNEVIKLKAKCSWCCQQTAQLTIRTSPHTERVVVGNDDIYKPICTFCFTKQQRRKDKKAKEELKYAQIVASQHEIDYTCENEIIE